MLSHRISLGFVAIISMGFLIACASTDRVRCGSYYSLGDCIVECENHDGWRSGHYLLTIFPFNRFELKEVSCTCGTFYYVCSGNLKHTGKDRYNLDNIPINYSYGVLGNPSYNNRNYTITIKSKDTIILCHNQWETTLVSIVQDSIPEEFDFSKYGYPTAGQ